MPETSHTDADRVPCRAPRVSPHSLLRSGLRGLIESSPLPTGYRACLHKGYAAGAMTVQASPEQAFRAYLSPQGIVRLAWRPGLCITGPLAAQAMAAVDALNDDQHRPLLVIMAGTDTPTREARQRFGHRCSASRIALLGRSPVDRVRASFPPELSSPGFPVPTRFFTSEQAALAWLLNPTADP
jgi:hypothetical protein